MAGQLIRRFNDDSTIRRFDDSTTIRRSQQITLKASVF